MHTQFTIGRNTPWTEIWFLRNLYVASFYKRHPVFLHPISFLLLHPLPISTMTIKELIIPLVKTTSFKSSFFVDVIPPQNSLPSNFVCCLSVSNFKHHIRSHFLTSFWQYSVLNITSVCVCVWGTLILALQLSCQPICIITCIIKRKTCLLG